MPVYPLKVEVDEKNILKLTDTFKKTYAEIVREINTATDFGIANRKIILRQIEVILEGLGTDVEKFLNKELPKYYKAGADDAVKQLRNVGADISVAEGFNRVHKDAIIALVDDTARAFGESMAGVSRSANLLLGKATRDLMTQKMAEGVIGGKALREVRQGIKGILQEQGLDALIDRGGHSWTLDRYAEMLFRTKAVETRNRGLANRMVENDYDLVQVSAHGADDVCGPWEGQILSLTGQTPGYPTVNGAEADGLFHPNCKHAVNVLIPKLAKQTNAYDTGTGEYQDEPGKSLLPVYEKLAETDLLSEARSYKPIFDDKLEKVAERAGLDWSDGPVKAAPRTAEKILYDYDGNIYGMKDVNRSVFFISDPKDEQTVNRLIDTVEKEFNTLGAKDVKRGLDITDGYASSKLSVNTPYGTKAEIQITTPEMWRAKTKLGGDELYELSRKPAVDEISRRIAREADEKMIKLYGEANAATLERLAK